MLLSSSFGHSHHSSSTTYQINRYQESVSLDILAPTIFTNQNGNENRSLAMVLSLSGFSLWGHTNNVSFLHQSPHLKNVKLNTCCLGAGILCT